MGQQTHTVSAAELNLGDVSSSGREFSGAVIFVELDEKKERVQIFTDLKRAPKEEGFDVAPHHGWWLRQDQQIELDTGASEKIREIWIRDDTKMYEYGKQVSLAHRKVVAQEKIKHEEEDVE